MSPASYLTAPPRVAVAQFTTGPALIGVGDQLGATLVDAAPVGDQRYQAQQLRALLRVQPAEKLVLHRLRRALGRGQAGPPFLRDLDDVPPAVLRIAATNDQAVGLEVVEQADELAGVDADRVDQRLLARGLSAHLEQHPEVARREAARLQRFRVPALGRASDLHQQHPRGRRVAPEELVRLLLGDLTRCHVETLANNEYLTSTDRIR